MIEGVEQEGELGVHEKQPAVYSSVPENISEGAALWLDDKEF